MYFSSCRHRIKSDCGRFLSNSDTSPKIFDQNEAECPICKIPVNTMIPVIPTYNIPIKKISKESSKFTFKTFVSAMCSFTASMAQKYKVDKCYNFLTDPFTNRDKSLSTFYQIMKETYPFANLSNYVNGANYGN